MMSTILDIGLMALVVLWLWMSIIACLALRRDDSLTTVQKAAQAIFAIVVPLFGAMVVLHLVYQHHPEVVSKSLVPWPIRTVIFGGSIPANTLRDEREGPFIGGYDRLNRKLDDFDGD